MPTRSTTSGERNGWMRRGGVLSGFWNDDVLRNSSGVIELNMGEIALVTSGGWTPSPGAQGAPTQDQVRGRLSPASGRSEV